VLGAACLFSSWLNLALLKGEHGFGLAAQGLLGSWQPAGGPKRRIVSPAGKPESREKPRQQKHGQHGYWQANRRPGGSSRLVAAATVAPGARWPARGLAAGFSSDPPVGRGLP